MTARHGFLILILSLGLGSGPAWGEDLAGVTVRTGVSSGLLVAPNPGAFYSTPVLTEIATEATFLLGFPIDVGVWVTLVPFLSRDPSFGRSLMTLTELGLGTRFRLRSFAGAVVFAGLYGGGGIYARTTDGVRAAGTARRPTALLRFSGGLSAERWEYHLSVTTRVLFDQEVVPAVAPAVGFRYLIPVGGDK